MPSGYRLGLSNVAVSRTRAGSNTTISASLMKGAVPGLGQWGAGQANPGNRAPWWDGGKKKAAGPRSKIAVDDTGWRRAVDQWEQVAELEIGEEAAAIP
jgi:hypothetical protein